MANNKVLEDKEGEETKDSMPMEAVAFRRERTKDKIIELLEEALSGTSGRSRVRLIWEAIELVEKL